MWKIEFCNKREIEITNEQAQEIKELLEEKEVEYLLSNNCFINLKNVNVIYEVNKN